jgi:phosphonoacetaldehyde hydrolase
MKGLRQLTPLFNSLKISRGFVSGSVRGLHTTPSKITRLSPAERLASPQLQLLQPERIKAAVLDWSGTTIDEHCLAPVEPILAVFKRKRVPITVEEAREPMGIPKRAHIAAILNLPRVQACWFELNNRKPNEQDLDDLYGEFLALELKFLPKYTTLIPGTAEAVNALRAIGVKKIGVSTGFPEKISERILEAVREQGFFPDSCVAADMVKHGARPAPHMLFRIMDELGVHDPREVVKIDDTSVGVGEGLEAGAWTVGMHGFSNHTGIESLVQLFRMRSSELAARREHAKEILKKSGAHYVIEGPWQLPGVVRQIDLRIANGETPTSKLNQKPPRPKVRQW